MKDIVALNECGKAAAEALEFSRAVVKEGASLLEVAEGIERFIKDRGFGLSFPVNISINEKAAHFTPPMDDRTVFHGNDLVKVDVGARKGDTLSDSAVTIDLSGNNQKMVDTAERALDEAISLVRSGRKVCEIGRSIEKTVEAAGFKPIRNLGGHGIEEKELHSGVFIPNFDNHDETELEEGAVVSIEPFITDGYGYVDETDEVQIYQLAGIATPRSHEARSILEIVVDKYKTYPFAARWLSKELGAISGFGIRRGISELLSIGTIEPFPVLIERKRGIVAQAEKQLIVEGDSCAIITKA